MKEICSFYSKIVALYSDYEMRGAGFEPAKQYGMMPIDCFKFLATFHPKQLKLHSKYSREQTTGHL